MEINEFRQLLLDSLKDEEVRTQIMKTLSEGDVSEKIKEFEDKIAKLEQQLKDDAASAESKYSDLKIKFDETSVQEAQAKADLLVRTKRVEELEAKVKEMEESISAAAKSGDEKTASLNEELEKLRTQLKEKEDDAADKAAKLSEATASAEALKAQVASLNASAEDMKKQLDATGSEKLAEIGRLNEKINALTEELENEKANGKQKDDAAAAANEQIEKLKADIDELTKKAADAEAAAGEKEKTFNDKIAELEGKATIAAADAEKVKKELEEKTSAFDELKKEYDTYKADEAIKIADNEAKTKAALEELDVQRDAAQKAADRAAGAEQSAMDLAQKLATMQEELSEKNNSIGTLNSQVQSLLVLRDKINEYAETANAYAQEVENARQILTEKETEIAEMRTQIDPLSQQVNELTAQNEQLNQAVATRDEQISEIGNYAQTLKDHNDELTANVAERNKTISEKTEELERLNREMEAYNATFGDLTSVFEQYKNLTPQTREGLKDVFPENSTVRSFLSSGAQLGHIQALWDFTYQKILREDFTDVKTLSSIFEYLLDFHNSSYESPLYEVLDTKPGEPFNEEIHEKVMSREERKNAFFAKSKPEVEGPIKEVVFYGYKNLKNNRVQKPSLVRV